MVHGRTVRMSAWIARHLEITRNGWLAACEPLTSSDAWGDPQPSGGREIG
jgi:hypothetical protein